MDLSTPGLNQGRIDLGRLRRTLAGLPLPKTADGRAALTVDVSPWLRPEARCPTARSAISTAVARPSIR
ncbi:transposase [Streptomyces globisporus]|uniref:transposase n=1 Tax=Streptomyces globisporus TaxID=1908 RepID=UPI0037FA75C4